LEHGNNTLQKSVGTIANPMQQEKFAILGGGNMGRALIGGLLRRGIRPTQIAVGETQADARVALLNDFSVEVFADNTLAAAQASFVVLAVKPQDAHQVLPPLAPVLQKNQAVMLSFAAGIRTETLEKWCGAGVAVVRAMPNRPALVGVGATALFASSKVSASECSRAENVMHAVGDVAWIKSEPAMDVVTALSGTGPAYFFFLAEMMINSAVSMGLDEPAARRLTLSTLFGSGVMARESDGDVVRLRAEVTSAKGTTEAAMHVLEGAKIREIMQQTLEAAAQRSRELAAQFGDPKP
jgi:pyrroline-5-carboxylate reductase